MTRVFPNLHDEAGRTTVAFRPTPPVIAPLAWLWCSIGGAALAFVATLTLTVRDLTTFNFDVLFAGLTVPGTLLIYLVVRLTTRPGVALQVTFDELSGFMTVARRRAREDLRFTVGDVGGFRLVQTDQRGCLLIMDTRTQGEILLISTRRHCTARHETQQGLQNFADRLNLAHDTTLHEMHVIHRPRTPVQPPPGTVISPADARRQRSIYTDPNAAAPYDSDPHRPAGLPSQMGNDEYD